MNGSSRFLYHRWTGKPRPGLPSGEDCCKQSDPKQFKLSVGHNGYKRVRGVGNPVHVSTLRLRRRLSAVMTAWYTRAMLAVSSSGGNLPPVSGEGECKLNELYEKKYLKKTSLWDFIWHIIYAGNRAAKKPCQPVKNAGLLRPGGNYIF